KMQRQEAFVLTGNPKSRDFSVMRNSLLPILMDFASHNQHADYPQRIFETGDIVIPDETMETRTKQVPSVCGLVTDLKVNITVLMTEIGFLLRNIGLDTHFSFQSKSISSYIEGRSAEIIINGEKAGSFGEISPEVLQNFGIGKPVIAFEIFLPQSGTWG
ncbi:MAG: phenylalanine--tRNA ligase subunit beta, partial [Candidatus Thorarchaeota archaeon]